MSKDSRLMEVAERLLEFYDYDLIQVSGELQYRIHCAQTRLAKTRLQALLSTVWDAVPADPKHICVCRECGNSMH